VGSIRMYARFKPYIYYLLFIDMLPFKTWCEMLLVWILGEKVIKMESLANTVLWQSTDIRRMKLVRNSGSESELYNWVFVWGEDKLLRLP
jgi:hypothetical protein